MLFPSVYYFELGHYTFHCTTFHILTGVIVTVSDVPLKLRFHVVMAQTEPTKSAHDFPSWRVALTCLAAHGYVAYVW